MSQSNKEFSITFWIYVKNNPGWQNENSEINFPPFTVNNGITVYFSKIRDKLKVYLLHPEIGYRKLVAKVTKYLNANTFVVLTNSPAETILYLNAEQVCKFEPDENMEPLEIGDYVMVEVKDNEVETLNIDGNIEVLLPARIKKIITDKIQFEFFTVGNKTQIVELDKNRIKK